MDELGTQVPVVTTWNVEIAHGIVDTDWGPIGGWGWVCREHDESFGYQGYENAFLALCAIQQHMRVCCGG
jgi:hypothetical protein